MGKPGAPLLFIAGAGVVGQSYGKHGRRMVWNNDHPQAVVESCVRKLQHRQFGLGQGQRRYQEDYAQGEIYASQIYTSNGGFKQV